MNWRIEFSKDSLKFLAQNNLPEEEIIENAVRAIRKFSGSVNF